MSLEAMHPLLYPPASPATSVWPWLAATAGALAGGLLLALWLYRRRSNPPVTSEPANPLIEALEQLRQLPRPQAGDQAGPWLQQLNLLLKRFCAVRYPDIASHKLSGREWLAFLDSRCPAAGLTRWMILVQGSYLPDCRLTDEQIAGLHAAITRWMSTHV